MHRMASSLCRGRSADRLCWAEFPSSDAFYFFGRICSPCQTTVGLMVVTTNSYSISARNCRQADYFEQPLGFHASSLRIALRVASVCSLVNHEETQTNRRVAAVSGLKSVSPRALATGADFTRSVRNVENARSYSRVCRILVKLPTVFPPFTSK